METGGDGVAEALEAWVGFERALVPRLVRRRGGSVRASAARLVAVVSGLSDGELVALDGRVRPWWWQHGVRERGLLRAALSSPDAVVVRAGAAAGAMSPDGYLREAAVMRLADDLPWSFSLLALRSTDWVAQVRGVAIEALERAEIKSLIEHLPLLEQLATSRVRARELAEWIERRLAAEEALGALSAGRRHQDVGVRRAAWRRLETRQPQLVGKELASAVTDPDLAIRLWAVRRLDRLEHRDRLALAPRLLGDPVGRVRAEGLGITLASAGREHHDEVARRYLPDRSAVVRRVAQAYLSRRSHDVANLYTDLLRERVTPAIVIGLAETAGRAALPELEQLLGHERPAVRRAALRALAQVAPDEACDLAVGCVSDDSELVACDALRILGKKATPAAHVAHIETAGTADARPRVRMTALSALRRWRWRCVALTLAQLADADADVRQHANHELRLWLRSSAHFYYGPTEQERRLVDAQLPNAPPDQRRAIEFVINTAQPP